MGAEAAAVSSIASVGFGVAGDLTRARGEAAGQTFEAEKAKRAAEYGRIKADQTDAQLREELANTLAQIDAIRASSNIDLSSPTGLAVKKEAERVAERERVNRVFSIRAQADEDEAASNYRRRVARAALTGGSLAAAARAFGGLAQAANYYR